MFAQTPPLVTISDIVTNYSSWAGQVVTVEGVVTLGAGVIYTDRLQAYITEIETTGNGRGIQIYRGGAPSSTMLNTFVRGAHLQVTGTVAMFQGNFQINLSTTTSFIRMDDGIPYELDFVRSLVVPLTIAQARQYTVWNGTYALVEGTITGSTTDSSGSNVTISDGSSNIAIRIFNATGINHSNFRTGVPIEVYAPVSSFGTGTPTPQLMLGYQNDVIIRLTDPVISNIVFSPNAPYVDEPITMTASIIDYDGYIETTKFEFRTDMTTNFTIGEINRIGTTENYTADIPAYDDLDTGAEGFINIRITATDNDGNVVVANDRVFASYRRPVITNPTFPSRPEPGAELYVSVTITPTIGVITEAKVFYTINFSNRTYEVNMLRNHPASNQFDAELPGFPAGTTVNITIWAINDSGYITTINTHSDGRPLRYTYPVTTSTAILRIEPKAYNIYENVHVEIGYLAKVNDKLIIRIYNAEGKLVATPVNIVVPEATGSNTPGVNFFTWNGRDKNFKLVEPGLYICHLEVIDRATGDKKVDKAPIVIGTRLK
jgi:hypothetical protein